MEKLDEEILKARRSIKQAEEKNHSQENIEKELEESIFSGKVHIYGQEVEFARRTLEEYGVSIIMPVTSYDLDKELKKAIYPMDTRPKYVFGNKSVDITVSFQHTVHKISKEQLEEFLAYSEKLLLSVGPKVMFLQKHTLEKEEDKIGVMEFVSSAMDTNVYNIQFYIPVEDGLLIGAINFPVKYKDRQMKIAQEMLQSVEIERTE